MGFTLAGLLTLAFAPNFGLILLSVALIGVGSSVFHPESSRGGPDGFGRAARTGAVLISGSEYGLFLEDGCWRPSIVLPAGQHSIAWFASAALLAILVLMRVGIWYKGRAHGRSRAGQASQQPRLGKRKVAVAMSVLIALIFSKYFYMASLTSYYTFFLIDKFHVPVRTAQLYLFVFLGAVAAGTIIGGPVGDRFGRRYVIWWSILGILPFTLALPYANLFWTGVLTVMIRRCLRRHFRPSWSTPRISRREKWNDFGTVFRASRSEWEESAPRCWGN